MTQNAEETNAVVINKEMTIQDILSLFPHKAQKLAHEITNAGLHCIGCQAATWETLEAGMLSHGKTEEQIDELVRRLNALLQEEEENANSIAITARAAAKYLQILQEEGKEGWGLRFALKMGGCSGFEYLLDFSEKASTDDEIFESHGIQIHVHKNLVQKLLGSTIDYIDGLHGAGFKVSNPNVKSSCGCGSSHGY